MPVKIALDNRNVNSVSSEAEPDFSFQDAAKGYRRGPKA
jgi:hypothetical protein